VRAGTLRALAVTTKERSALLPDLPSLHEAGIPGYDVTHWAGLFAPAGTPGEIVTRLNDEVRKIIADPDSKAKIAVTGFDAFSGPPEALAAFVQSELATWGRLIKDAGSSRSECCSAHPAKAGIQSQRTGCPLSRA